jgi:hypothetical protein
MVRIEELDDFRFGNSTGSFGSDCDEGGEADGVASLFLAGFGGGVPGCCLGQWIRLMAFKLDKGGVGVRHLLLPESSKLSLDISCSGMYSSSSAAGSRISLCAMVSRASAGLTGFDP